MDYPLFPKEELPQFNSIAPGNVKSIISEKLAANRTKIDQLLSETSPYSWDNLLNPIETISDELNQLWSPISHMHAVVESEELRKAYNETLPLIIDYHTAIAQNEKLYQATQKIAEDSRFKALSKAQRKIIENDLRDFKLAGIHLPSDKKAEFAKRQQHLSELMTKFAENLLDATNGFILPIEDEKQLEGLPPQAIKLASDNAKMRGLSGHAFTLDYPSFSTGIKYLQDRNLRKILYEAYVTRASEEGPNATRWDNSLIMDEILKCRHEIAKLVGFNNYAEYALATKMAKTKEDVLDLLNDLVIRSKPIAEKEYQEVKAFAKTLDNLETVEAWDMPYYSEKLRESKFKFTQEELRPYFPIEHVLSGLFKVVNKVFGLTVKPETNVEVWHPHVRFFSIYDQNNALRGGFYIDLYARPHKRDGAWMDECRNRRRFSNNDIQYPVAYLTCNFMRPVDDQPALLTHDDVLTLFHEFGHCLQHILTTVDYPSVGGINGIPWDAVEFPSQFMENYCWEKESLALFAAHYQTNAPLPEDLYQKMISAKHFQSGMQMLRQLEFALFDFQLHLTYNPEQKNIIQRLLNEVRREVSVVPVPAFNRFQHSFSHVFAGSYAAGYYSYKWAEVLSADAYAKFEENGIFDKATGNAFMKNILETGGVSDPLQAFIAFRGREPSIVPLLKQSGIG
jgi:oligopeptidase A